VCVRVCVCVIVAATEIDSRHYNYNALSICSSSTLHYVFWKKTFHTLTKVPLMFTICYFDFVFNLSVF
jgi:hypothetical protein